MNDIQKQNSGTLYCYSCSEEVGYFNWEQVECKDCSHKLPSGFCMKVSAIEFISPYAKKMIRRTSLKRGKFFQFFSSVKTASPRNYNTEMPAQSPSPTAKKSAGKVIKAVATNYSVTIKLKQKKKNKFLTEFEFYFIKKRKYLKVNKKF